MRIWMSLILISVLIAGCSRAKAAPAEPDLADPRLTKVEIKAETPDLSGGSEAQVRTINTKQIADLSKQFPNIFFYSGSRNAKKVALTFDDGPDNIYTGQILTILHRENIKATFFVVGVRAKAHPEVIRRIAAEGHAIGNHTWDHHSISDLTPNALNNEILQTDSLLTSILGYHPILFRPPYGAIKAETVPVISGMGYKIIGWSVDTRDWAGTSPQQIQKNVLKEVYAGGIILQHSAGGSKENLSNTVKALPQIISTLKAQGYDFVTVPKLLNLN